MQELSNRNFGLMIAYLIPGFIAVWGISYLAPEVSRIMVGTTEDGPTLGGFMYVTLGSIAAGMTSNAVRWAILDSLHHQTGLKRPELDDATLHERVTAYEWLVENHYRHYQFYGNTLCAVMFTYLCWQASLTDLKPGVDWHDGAAGALSLILAAGSRSTLARYYRRSESLLGSTTKE